MIQRLMPFAFVLAIAPIANAELIVTTTQGVSVGDLAHTYSNTDLLAGKLPDVIDPAPPYGPTNRSPWYLPNNTDPRDQEQCLTDGLGFRTGGATGLLKDYASESWAGSPFFSTYAIKVTYDLGAPTNLGELRVFSGNPGRDGRVFHTYLLETSTTATGDNFTVVKYVQSHPTGTVNAWNINFWISAVSSLTSTTGTIAPGVRRVRLTFWSVTDISEQKIMDPFLGVNPYTGEDDGTYGHAGETPYQSPCIWEIDLFAAAGAPNYAGKVVLQDFGGDITQVPVTIELRQAGVVKETHEVTLAADGSFNFSSALSGTYDVTAKASHWLRAKLAGKTLGGGSTGLDLSLINGDIDGDNSITVFDYTDLSNAFDTVPGDASWNPAADLDGDDSVTVFDYSILSNNFDLSGEE